MNIVHSGTYLAGAFTTEYAPETDYYQIINDRALTPCKKFELLREKKFPLAVLSLFCHAEEMDFDPRELFEKLTENEWLELVDLKRGDEFAKFEMNNLYLHKHKTFFDLAISRGWHLWCYWALKFCLKGAMGSELYRKASEWVSIYNFTHIKFFELYHRDQSYHECALDLELLLKDIKLNSPLPLYDPKEKVLFHPQSEQHNRIRDTVSRLFAGVYGAAGQCSKNDFDITMKIKFSPRENTSTYSLYNRKCLEHSILNNKVWKIDTVYKNIKKYFNQRYITRFFNGNEVESSYFGSREPQDDVFWDSWEATSSAYDHYSELIHPLVKEVACQLLKDADTKDTSILEICGGKGELAKSILAELKNVTYVLIDNNLPSVVSAKTRLKDRATVIAGDVVNVEAYYLDSEKTASLQRGEISLAIGSGALTHEVLPNKKDAEVVLKRIYAYLKMGGFLILAGIAPSFFKAKEFKSHGFKVYNSHFPGTKYNFYVLEKGEIPSPNFSQYY